MNITNLPAPTLPADLHEIESTRWRAVQSRDPQAAHSFVYCVKTTKIACRPNCAARLARRANVIFHNTIGRAIAAGFRPCKRCKPELAVYEPNETVFERAHKAIQEASADLKVIDMAAMAGLKKRHFNRVVKNATGVTPRAYAARLRAEKSASNSSSMNSPIVIPSSVTPRPESEEAVAPIARNEEDGDVGRDFINEDLPATEGLPEEPDRQSSSMNDLAVPSVIQQWKDVECAVHPWDSGFIFVAATKDGICRIESGASLEELSQSLIDRFPYSKIDVYKWPQQLPCQDVDLSKYTMFSQVMEALINPTGKILYIPFDVPELLNPPKKDKG